MDQKTIKLGSVGKDVSGLQNMLNKVLQLSPSLMVDGKFGEKTKKAVIQYQKKSNLQKTVLLIE